jgi:LysM repeat protein
MIRQVIRGISHITLLFLLFFGGVPAAQAQYETPTAIPVPSPYELIQQVNWLRNGNGYAALEIDPILMASAQAVAEGWAYNNYLDHSGNTREKLIAAGYGAGDVPWGTENVASGPNMSISDVLAGPWNDALHAIPWVSPNYRHIGAAIVEVDGKYFYVLHAGYTSNGTYQPGVISTPDPNDTPTPAGVSQLVIAVWTAVPDTDGRVVHEVRPGQSLWAIADAYGSSVADLAAINGLSAENPILYVGQKLQIRLVNPALTGTAIPTMIQPSKTPTPAPSLTGLPTIEQTMSPTVAITQTDYDTRERWWLFGILAMLGVGLMLVTLGNFGSKT